MTRLTPNHAPNQRDLSDNTPVPPRWLESSQGTASEPDLLARLRAGDEAAFEALVRRETGHLLAVARRLLRNEEDARDTVQQAFLSAFRALPAFHGQSRLSTWLHRIVTNAALAKLRTRARQPEDSIEDLLPRFREDGHHVEQFSEWDLPADVKMLRRETRAHVRAAIEMLPDSYRTVLLLRDVEEFSTEETARALGVNPDTVKTRLHRARQALLKLLNARLDKATPPAREMPQRAVHLGCESHPGNDESRATNLD